MLVRFRPGNSTAIPVFPENSDGDGTAAPKVVSSFRGIIRTPNGKILLWGVCSILDIKISIQFEGTAPVVQLRL